MQADAAHGIGGCVMKRRRTPELMDDPFLESAAHARALRSLNAVNRLLGVDRMLHDCVQRVIGSGGATILDLGSGGAGFLSYCAGRFNAEHRYRFLGLDRSWFALNWSRERQVNGTILVAGDACRLPLADDSVDLVTCSLFLHHFDEEDVLTVLREASRVARRGIVIADLRRSRLAWVLTWLFTRLVSRSRVFHIDGPRSVRSAFHPNELARLATRSGLSGAQIERRFPFRLVLSWRRPGGVDEHL
jgi:SAM-dependent methyltransferase